MYSVYIYSRIIVITVLYWWAWLTLVIIWSSLYFSVFWIHFLVMVALIIYFWIRLDGPQVVELDARFLGLIKINKQGRSCRQKKFQAKSWTVFFQTDWQCKDGWATTVQWVGGGGGYLDDPSKKFYTWLHSNNIQWNFGSGVHDSDERWLSD